MIITQQVHPTVGPWTFGTGGKGSRFGSAYPDGRTSLRYWEERDGQQHLVQRVIYCRSYRRAVRLLRMHLKGYNV